MGEKKNKAAAARHQALYRKYRLKSLGEMVGQEHITTTLGQAIQQGKVNHAYLFTGPRGTGKTSVARILAHEINNLPYHDDAPHLDIIEIDAASNRRIDDIRDLRDKVHIAPVAAKYKVYIIDEVHMLTSESFNALLKTLEEPPAHVVFILATTEAHKLPATIMSRTQRHNFRLTPPEKVAKHLAAIAKKEGLEIDADALGLLAQHGGGSFRDSITLLDQVSGTTGPISAGLVESLLGLAPKDALRDVWQAAKKGGAQAVFQAVDSLLESGLTAGGIALQLVELLREEARTSPLDAQAIGLMDKLLGVPNAQYPQLKLEISLLALAPLPAGASKESADPAPQSNLSVNRPAQPAIIPAKIKTEKPPGKVPKASKKPNTGLSQFIVEEHWPKVLELIKQKNNPLYTVLRLATPELNDQELLLIFSFPFHQKKASEVQYKALLSATIETLIGTPLTVETIVDKTRAKTTSTIAAEAAVPAKLDPAHASHISTIQDIMGGGEVVRV